MAFRHFERFWNSRTISNDFVGVIRRVIDISNTIEAYSPSFRTKVLNALVKRNLSFQIKVGIAVSPSEDYGKLEFLSHHWAANGENLLIHRVNFAPDSLKLIHRPISVISLRNLKYNMNQMSFWHILAHFIDLPFLTKLSIFRC